MHIFSKLSGSFFLAHESCFGIIRSALQKSVRVKLFQVTFLLGDGPFFAKVALPDVDLYTGRVLQLLFSGIIWKYISSWEICNLSNIYPATKFPFSPKHRMLLFFR